MKRGSKKDNKKQTVLSIILAVVLVSSILGIMVNRDSNPDNFKYSFNNKSIDFGTIGNRYYLDFGEKRVFFYNLPDQIRTNISFDAADRIKNSQMVYVTFDPDDNQQNLIPIDLTRLELNEEFFNNNKYLISGKTSNSSNYPNLPILDCANATAYIPVIKFQNSNTTEIIEENNCIIMKGRNLDFIKYRDLILYKYYGVY